MPRPLPRTCAAKPKYAGSRLTGDYNGDPISVEFGAGLGMTPASDGLTVKLMFMTDLTGEHGLFTEMTRQSAQH